ncbi:MAG: DUF2959 domain-containing protein [Desulfopila sp.]
MQQQSSRLAPVWLALMALAMMMSGCADTYYDAMEKVGIHKRDIMVDRVEEARDAQKEAQEQFTSALDQFNAVVQLQDSDLKRAYERLNSEYEASRDAAATVTSRIDKVESVAEALFAEWEDELDLYQNAEYRRTSRIKLDKTRVRYREMLASMHRAEQSMEPVLRIFRDNVLYLKHNLNAQAIGALKGEFSSLKTEISRLVTQMNRAIDQSNSFIADIQ